MDRNKFVSLVSLVVYLTGSMPIQGMCSESNIAVESIAKDLLVCVETGAEETVLHKIQELEGVFENAPNAFEEGRKFIQSFVDEMNLRYGMHLTLADACVLVRDNFERLQLPQEVQKDLLIVLELYESKMSQSPSQKISERTYMSKSGLHIYPPWEWNFFGLNKRKHPKIKSEYVTATACAKTELELPSKMAIGFVCAFAGALLCIVPGCQMAGVWMMGTGASIALDGLGEGERPYYRNLDTGEIIPFGNPE